MLWFGCFCSLWSVSSLDFVIRFVEIDEVELLVWLDGQLRLRETIKPFVLSFVLAGVAELHGSENPGDW